MREQDNKSIGVGDMVQIVRPAPCGCHGFAGDTFIVERLKLFQTAHCHACGFVSPTPIILATNPSGEMGTPISRLIKIAPPPEELKETTDSDLEVTA